MYMRMYVNLSVCKYLYWSKGARGHNLEGSGRGTEIGRPKVGGKPLDFSRPPEESVQAWSESA